MRSLGKMLEKPEQLKKLLQWTHPFHLENEFGSPISPFPQKFESVAGLIEKLTNTAHLLFLEEFRSQRFTGELDDRQGGA